ncbi:MAG TPA: HAMP domain-containing sensor histidine kinase [Candidatus Cybelea sp.]|nr:HAMP domain-containing sensor histidine kinase [Candidatus Cybelea sp.]
MRESGAGSELLRAWRPVFILAAAVLLIGVGWSAKALIDLLDTMRATEVADVGWNASQLEVQLVKVQHLLAEAKAGNPQRLLLQRRWDNLLSWIGPMEASVTEDLRRAQPDFAPTLSEVESGLAEMQAYVNVRHGDLVQSVDLLEGPAAELAVPIRRLAVMGDQYWNILIERRRAILVDRIEALALFSAGLLLLLAANQAVLVQQQRALKQMATRLRGALSDAEAAGSAKTSFLARMSHELRTPLNAIIGFAEIMELEMFGPIANVQYREYTAGMLRSGRGLLGLVDSVLDIARIDAGTVPITPELVALDEIARRCIDTMRAPAEKGAVEIANAVPEGLPRLRVDPAHLCKILLQLLDNAVKFAPGCRVELGARRCDDAGLEIWVRDSGAGIAAQDLKAILKPFNQVGNHLVYHGEGLGLGLPIAKSLTELNGGRFEILSAPGRGTEARMRFGDS